MGEWLKPAVLKTVSGVTRSGVRIPLPPPDYFGSRDQHKFPHFLHARCGAKHFARIELEASAIVVGRMQANKRSAGGRQQRFEGGRLATEDWNRKRRTHWLDVAGKHSRSDKRNSSARSANNKNSKNASSARLKTKIANGPVPRWASRFSRSLRNSAFLACSQGVRTGYFTRLRARRFRESIEL